MLSKQVPYRTRHASASERRHQAPVVTDKNKKAVFADCYVLANTAVTFSMAERQRFELWNGFRPLHDFQSCSFGQLGHLSVSELELCTHFLALWQAKNQAKVTFFPEFLKSLQFCLLFHELALHGPVWLSGSDSFLPSRTRPCPECLPGLCQPH